jgi:hypothetical protein
MKKLFVKRREGNYIDRGLVKFERVDFKNQIANIGTTLKPWSVFEKYFSVLHGES